MKTNSCLLFIAFVMVVFSCSKNTNLPSPEIPIQPIGDTNKTINVFNIAPCAFIDSGESDFRRGVIYFKNCSNDSANTFLWQFGDGTESRDKHPVHWYADTGKYEVSLQAGYNELSDTVALSLNVLYDFRTTIVGNYSGTFTKKYGGLNNPWVQCGSSTVVENVTESLTYGNADSTVLLFGREYEIEKHSDYPDGWYIDLIKGYIIIDGGRIDSYENVGGKICTAEHYYDLAKEQH